MTSDLPPTGGSQPPSDPSPAESAEPAGSAPPQTDPSAAPGSSTRANAGPGSFGHASSSHQSFAHASDDFFNRIRSFGAVRPEDGRWGAGVAVGLARRWDVDPILVRGLFVATSLIGGVGVILYGLAWLLMPQDDGRIHVQQAIRGDVTGGFIGAVILTVLAFGTGGGPWHNGFWFFPGGLVLAVLAVIGVFWLAKRTPPPGGTPSGRTPTESGPSTAPGTPPAYGSPSPAAPTAAPNAWTLASQRATEASRRASETARLKSQEATQAAKARRARSAPSKMIVRLTLGTALLVAAAIVVIGNSQDWDAPVGVIAAASALAVIAAGVIASGLSGRRAAGLAGIGVLLTLGTLAGAGAEHAGVRSGQNLTLIGQTDWTPTTPTAAERQFNLLVGEGTLWLNDPAILGAASSATPLHVQARVGAGHLTVVLPDDTSAQVDLTLGAGQAQYPDGRTQDFNSENGPRRGGGSESVHVGPSGAPLLIVDIEQGAGQLQIRTASDPELANQSPITPSATPTPSPSPAATKN